MENFVASWRAAFYEEERWQYVIAAGAAHTLPVLFWFITYTFFDCFPHWFGKYKIQKTTANMVALWLSPAAREAYDGGSVSSTRNFAMFVDCVKDQLFLHLIVVPALLFFVFFDMFKWLDPEFVTGPLPPWPRIALNMLVCMLVEDTMFYWSHRFLHWKVIYPYIHKKHHTFYTPTTLAAEFAHPIEALLGNHVPFLAGMVLMRCRLLEGCLWSIIRLSKTAEEHGGYAFPLTAFNFFPLWLAGARRHDFHHSNNRGCFGSFFNHWDWLCGTDAPFLEHEKKRLAAAGAK